VVRGAGSGRALHPFAGARAFFSLSPHSHRAAPHLFPCAYHADDHPGDRRPTPARPGRRPAPAPACAPAGLRCHGPPRALPGPGDGRAVRGRGGIQSTAGAGGERRRGGWVGGAAAGANTTSRRAAWPARPAARPAPTTTRLPRPAATATSVQPDRERHGGLGCWRCRPRRRRSHRGGRPPVAERGAAVVAAGRGPAAAVAASSRPAGRGAGAKSHSTPPSWGE